MIVVLPQSLHTFRPMPLGKIKQFLSEACPIVLLNKAHLGANADGRPHCEVVAGFPEKTAIRHGDTEWLEGARFLAINDAAGVFTLTVDNGRAAYDVVGYDFEGHQYLLLARPGTGVTA